MQSRYKHLQEVTTFLQNHFARQDWQITQPPHGSEHEAYIAQGGTDTYFIKLDAQHPQTALMAALDLTPKVIASGVLESGATILVQAYVRGHMPSWQAFRQNLKSFALLLKKTHNNRDIKGVLPKVASELYRDAGIRALDRVLERWKPYRPQVPILAGSIDEKLDQLRQEIGGFTGRGLVSSHNDPSNGNWLIGSDGKIYLLDPGNMSLDDPAHDLGALLWWYYPPGYRREFLEIVGQPVDPVFFNRMRVRMARHCLDILLPRVGTYDTFDIDCFTTRIGDFFAVAKGQENPRGYDD